MDPALLFNGLCWARIDDHHKLREAREDRGEIKRWVSILAKELFARIHGVDAEGRTNA